MAGLPRAEDPTGQLAVWFATAQGGDGSPWLTQGEAEALAGYALRRGCGVRMMEAAKPPFREPPDDTDWEMIGADAPGENWHDHHDPGRAFALLRHKLRAAAKTGAHLHYKLWLEAAPR